MKHLLILSSIFLMCLLKAQTSYVSYDYYTKSPIVELTFHQVATLYVNENKSLYEVSPIDNMEETTKEMPDGAILVLKKDDFMYSQFYDDKALLISDKLQGKKYFLVDDNLKLDWIYSEETKTIDGVMVRKASTEFRGRNYIAWFDPNVLFKYGPWKFQGLNYLIVEVSSTDGKALWKLNSQPKSKKEVLKNPFTEVPESEFRKYHEYPTLAYGLSAQLKEALSKNPNNKMFEQNRNQLEIKFEWEK